MSLEARIREDAAVQMATFGQAVTYHAGGLAGTALEIQGILDWAPLAPMPGAPEIPTHDWVLEVLRGGTDGVADPSPRLDLVDLVDLAGKAWRCKVTSIIAADEGVFVLGVRRGGPVPEEP